MRLLLPLLFAALTVHAAETETPLSTPTYTPGLDVKAMEASANPCDDFYQYACGGWMKTNPIPPDQSKWGVYSKLSEDNQRFLWGILQKLAAAKSGNTLSQQKIGDYFAACMDESAIEKAHAQPLTEFFAAIDQMKSANDLAKVLGRLQSEVPDGNFIFHLESEQDYANSNDVIAFLEAGGLGLPDRDYYFKSDAKSKAIRAKYLTHLEKTFTLLGADSKAAKQNAELILKLETELAKRTLTRVERRDPYKLFHKMSRGELIKLTPIFDWSGFFSASGLPQPATLNVTEPKFFKGLNDTFKDKRLNDLKIYLRWHVAHAMAPYLSADFVNENFDFYSKILRGVQILPPRWKRCVRLVDRQLGEALGQEFVQRVFSAELKKKTLAMTEQIEQAMQEDIQQLSWMDPSTKIKGLEKLKTIVNKVGYPDHWRDYSALTVKRGDFAGNVGRGHQFEVRRELAKIGKPLDRTEWGMTPSTVNAYYDPQMNDINFPAAVLQPPLYDSKMDDAPNYGNTGGCIGHELTHAFDDEGRKFDSKGNLKDWWTKADAKAFDQRAKCLVDQYGKYKVVDDIKINSHLTEGEDIADLGGLILAWKAWKSHSDEKGARDGLSPEQRFFVGYAQWACENARPETSRMLAQTDEHSPAKYRVNGLVVNMPEFAKAFACRAGQKMAPKNRCRVW